MLKPKKGKEEHTLHQKVKGETPHPTKPQGWKLSLLISGASETKERTRRTPMTHNENEIKNVCSNHQVWTGWDERTQADR